MELDADSQMRLQDYTRTPTATAIIIGRAKIRPHSTQAAAVLEMRSEHAPASPDTKRGKWSPLAMSLLRVSSFQRCRSSQLHSAQRAIPFAKLPGRPTHTRRASQWRSIAISTPIPLYRVLFCTIADFGDYNILLVPQACS